MVELLPIPADGEPLEPSADTLTVELDDPRSGPDPALIALCRKLGLNAAGRNSVLLARVATHIKQAGWTIRDRDKERHERNSEEQLRQRRRDYERVYKRTKGLVQSSEPSDWMPSHRWSGGGW